MPPIVSTSGRLHSEFSRLLFLQSHRETDRFITVSGVQLPESTSGLFHFHRVAFSSTLKVKVGSTLDKAVGLRITLNIDGTFITSKSSSLAFYWHSKQISGPPLCPISRLPKRQTSARTVQFIDPLGR